VGPIPVHQIPLGVQFRGTDRTNRQTAEAVETAQLARTTVQPDPLGPSGRRKDVFGCGAGNRGGQPRVQSILRHDGRTRPTVKK